MQSYPKYLSTENRRALTVASVVELAGSHNPGEITTEAIAQRMHMTQGVLYRHFSSKKAIWHAVMDWVAEGLLTAIDRSARGIESPLAAMEAMFMSHIEFVAKHPGVPRIMFGELQLAQTTPAKRVAQSVLGRYRERLHRLIEKGQAAGEISPSLDKEAAVTLFLGSIQGLVIRSLLVENMTDMRREAERIFALLIVLYRCGIGSDS